MDSVPRIRRHCFVEEDDGLASLADKEAGFSGNHHVFHSRPLCYSRRSSFRNFLAASSPSSCSLTCSPRSGWFYDPRFEDPQPHFLESCFLCKKRLGDDTDIYMYRLVSAFLCPSIYLFFFFLVGMEFSSIACVWSKWFFPLALDWKDFIKMNSFY